MAEGYISVFRQVTEHELWQDKPFSKGHAWVDLLLLAFFKEKKMMIGNNDVIIKRGQLLTTFRFLEDRWGWSNTKVNNFLAYLVMQKMISKENINKKTLITIENYEDYQTTSDKKATIKRHENDNKNNVNNIYNNICDFWNEQKIVVHRTLSQKMIKQLEKRLAEYTPEIIKQAISNYSTALKDENYELCDYAWSLEEFLSREKGMPAFVDEGWKWLNYKNATKGRTKNNQAVKRPDSNIVYAPDAFARNY